jgi:AraC-like DNA-binding protein
MNTLLASKLRLPKKGMIRAAPMATLPAVMRELGADFEPIMAAHGLSNQVFEDPEASVSYETMCGVLAACSRASGCPHIGLLVGQRGGIASLGVLGYLMLNAPDVRSALDTLIQHMDVHDRGAAPRLELSSHVVMLRYDILLSNVDGSAPVSDAALAIGRNIMLSLCGPTWKPLEVHLRHAAPDDVSPYRRFFQAPVVFNAERTALVFGSPWLSAPVPGADSALRRHFQDFVDALSTQVERSFEDQVYPAIQRLLAENRCTLDELARRFSMHPRGLARRLQQAGTSFRALQNQARHALARELLRDTTSDMATIANLLGYTSASAFVRAFAAREGLPPAAWRRTAAARSAAPGAGASAANRSA